MKPLLAALTLAAMTAAAVPPAAAQSVSDAPDPKAYRIDGARHLYARYADRIYKGKLPPLIHAIVVAEVDLDAQGQVRGIQMIRTPSHAPDVTARVREMIRAASPLPAPARLGSAARSTSTSGWSTRAAASSSTR